jgi:myo-inositol-1(or 4)-monophosphatase
MNHYDFVIDLVHEAGARLKEASLSAFETMQKGGEERDVLTSVDLEINTFLISELQKAFPEYNIASEEKGTPREQVSDYTWMLDPIDGTANFSRGIPHFAVCVALVHLGVPIVGAVYNPITDELFSFEKGRGAFLNRKPITVSKVTELRASQGILVVGHKADLWDWGTAVYRSFLENLKKLKALGSSGLDLSFLAAGRADIVVYGTLTTEDIACAIGIVREAGGEVYTADGEPVAFSPIRQTVIATSSKEIFDKVYPHLHTDLLPR